MDHWGPKHVEPPSVMNKLNHKTLCIWLVYIYIARWYTVHTISNPSLCYPPIDTWVFKVVPSLRFPHQTPLYTSPLSHTCYMPRPSHPPPFDHPNIWWGGERIILEEMFKKSVGSAWTRSIWRRIGTVGGLLWTRWWTFWFHKLRAISWLAEELLASQEGLCCAELAYCNVCVYGTKPPP